MTPEKITAALTVLGTVDAAGDDRRRIGQPEDWLAYRTGLTVADLRALLVAAQWRDPSEPPAHSGPVQIETCDGLRVARYVCGTWDGIDAPLLPEDVRRWRELPR